MKIFKGTQFFTHDQFIAFLQGQQCCHCHKKAKWLPFEKGLGYCDEHWPFKEELEDQKKEPT